MKRHADAQQRIPYNKQSTEENRTYRKEFRQAQRPLKQMEPMYGEYEGQMYDEPQEAYSAPAEYQNDANNQFSGPAEN